jgi:hypothetical protein
MRTGEAKWVGVGAGLSALALGLAAPALAAPEEPGRARYLWNLATETGPVRTSGHGLTFDPVGKEILVTGGDLVRIFQANGMEDFSFTSAGMVDRLLSAAVLGESGDILLLGTSGQGWSLARASFRGEPLGTVVPRDAPAGFLSEFFPGLVRVQAGRLYLADTQRLRVLVLERDGGFVRAVDVAEVLGIERSKREDNQLSGFNVDLDGGLLFTLAVKFRAYALSPSGELREWGTPGGAPGFFNVVSGIAADARHYYVADQLKCAVIAFDRADLSFVDEFGYRVAESEGGLIGPTQIAAGNGRIFVSQNANRGVAVFAAPEGERKDAVKVSAAATPGLRAGEAAPQ